jgi:hypothetical protein
MLKIEIIAGAVLVGASMLIWAGTAFARYRKGRAVDKLAPESGTRTAPIPSTSGNSAPDGLPRVRAMLVGPAQSGKTMQLAAMHHQLAVGDSGVKLRSADDHTFQALGSMVTRIMHPETPAPPPSTDPANIFRWNFQIEARGPSADLQPLFHLTYLDYAGEIGHQVFEAPKGGAGLQQANNVKQQFQDAVKNFDVLLGVLDGAKIAQAMFDPEVPSDLEQDIWQTLDLLSIGHQPVTHLVLTKWDEFYSRGIPLDDVVAHLDRHSAFRSLRSMGLPGQLRLIPVSALGREPYLIVGPDARLVRSNYGPWNPYNPGLPLACGITDIVAADLKKLEATETKKSAKYLSVPTSPVFAAMLAGLGLLAMGSHPSVIPALLAGRKVEMTLEVPVGMIVQAFRGAFHRGESQQAKRADQLLALPGRQDPVRRVATANLLAYCAQRAYDLELEHPASDLTRPSVPPITPIR